MLVCDRTFYSLADEVFRQWASVRPNPGICEQESNLTGRSYYLLA